MQYDRSALHENLASLRLAKGLSREIAAGLLGVDAKTVGRIESGSSEPTLRTLRRYAAVFDVSLDEIASDAAVDQQEDLRRQIVAWRALWTRDAGRPSAMFGTLARSSRNPRVAAAFADLAEAHDANPEPAAGRLALARVFADPASRPSVAKVFTPAQSAMILAGLRFVNGRPLADMLGEVLGTMPPAA